MRFDDLTAFVRSATTGSFSNAAREIDVLPAQISASIKRLEMELGIRLFARSTRSLRLTADGERYLPFAERALSALREGQENLRLQDVDLSGVLQITAPSDLGRNVLLKPFTDFRLEHPGLELRLFLSDQLTDVFREPADIALRYGILEDASFVSLPIVPRNRRVLFASPAYLDAHGRPGSLKELCEHDCLIYMLSGRPYDRWEFPDGEGRKWIDVSGPLVANDADVVRRWAVAGQGIGYKSELDVADDVFAGRLEVVLPEIEGKLSPLSLICPHWRQLTPSVQKLCAYLREYFLALDHSRSPKLRTGA
ncbi:MULTISPECIES: LysR family transcriptional regulator [Burkholderiaceae]|uniref:LysR family transcriptional regulator n=1 Tax=Burkholderiaceae TaxID=119060 RepID=UPI000AC207A3